MRVESLFGGLILCTACASQPRCREYIPAFPAQLSSVEVTRGDTTGPTTLSIVGELGERPRSPVHAELTAENGASFRADSAIISIAWPGGRTHLRVRAAGYRPADTTFALTSGNRTNIQVRLRSLVIETPPLQLCDR